MQNQERRRDYRLNSQETILLELMAASFDGQSPSEVLICHSVDISANGLQVSVNQPLQAGLILNMAVQLNGELPINLVTEVKWQYPAEADNQWRTGLALLDSEGSGLAQWKRLIARRLLDDPE